MKKKNNIALIVFLVLPFLSFAQNAADDGKYAFIIVDGVWKNGTSYTSGVIYFPGYNNCDRYSSIEFFDSAKRSFSNHLKAYHNSAFPYGENNNFQIIDTKRFSTTVLLKTRAQADQRMTEWVADQKSANKQVVLTNFSFSCDYL
jgi:hypothetical protein